MDESGEGWLKWGGPDKDLGLGARREEDDMFLGGRGQYLDHLERK